MLKRAMIAAAVLALVGVGVYAAATLVDSFEYKFDTKDSVEGWVANGDAKVEWKEGGPDKAPGCMRVTGDHASVDSPVVNFKCGENTLSFDYYVHGTDSFRMRLSVASADDQKKYGRYGNLMIRKVEADKWIHVETKLADVLGMAEEGKAKAFADLAYNKIGFSSIAAVEAGGYIQVANVKMGKAGGAASAPSK